MGRARRSVRFPSPTPTARSPTRASTCSWWASAADSRAARRPIARRVVQARAASDAAQAESRRVSRDSAEGAEGERFELSRDEAAPNGFRDQTTAAAEVSPVQGFDGFVGRECDRLRDCLGRFLTGRRRRFEATLVLETMFQSGRFPGVQGEVWRCAASATVLRVSRVAYARACRCAVLAGARVVRQVVLRVACGTGSSGRRRSHMLSSSGCGRRSTRTLHRTHCSFRRRGSCGSRRDG